MKIAVIGHKRVPSREGGVEVVVTETAKRLSRYHQLVIYNRKTIGDDSSIVEYCGAIIKDIFTFPHSGLNAAVYSLLATVRAIWDGADLIHFHAEGPAVMCLIPHLFKIPTVVTIHGCDWKRSKWGRLSSTYIKMGERIGAKYADEVIVLSEPAREYFKNTYGRDTAVVKNGVSFPEDIDCKAKSHDGGYIIFAARLVPEKGLHLLIDAFKRLKTSKRLLIAGRINPNDRYVKEVMTLAEHDERIVFLDFVEQSELWELYLGCDIYVLPSQVEGMSLSLMEALGCGARCLVSDLPENIAVAPDYVYTFRSGDKEDLLNSMAALIENKRENSQEQIDFMRRNYSWDKCAEETLKVLNRAGEKAV